MADLNSAGELKSDKGTPYSFWFLRSSGHTVYFNNSNPITIYGIRIYGCKWGSENEKANISVSVWDDKLQTLYQDQYRTRKVSLNSLAADNKCSNNAKWAEIPLPGYTVNGNFFITIVTESYPINENKPGIYIGYNLNSGTHSSHSTLVNPNRIIDTPIQPSGSKTAFELSEIDWMIRVLYKNSGNISFSGPATPALSVSATPLVSTSVQPAPATPLGTSDTQFPMTTVLIGGVAVLAGIGGLVYFRSSRNRSNIAAETTPSLPAATQSDSIKFYPS